MSTLDIILLALGRGHLRTGARLAAFAVGASLPVFVGLAITLAAGPGR